MNVEDEVHPQFRQNTYVCTAVVNDLHAEFDLPSLVFGAGHLEMAGFWVDVLGVRDGGFEKSNRDRDRDRDCEIQPRPRPRPILKK